jgi:hypothetical protein
VSEEGKANGVNGGESVVEPSAAVADETKAWFWVEVKL